MAVVTEVYRGPAQYSFGARVTGTGWYDTQIAQVVALPWYLTLTWDSQIDGHVTYVEGDFRVAPKMKILLALLLSICQADPGADQSRSFPTRHALRRPILHPRATDHNHGISYTTDP